MDENLVKAFIKKNADKIYDEMNNKGSFNIYAGLFGIFYFLYRKMVIYSFLIFLIQAVVVSLVEALKLPGLFSFLSMFIICGFSFYPFYKMHIENTIREIMSKAQNQEETYNMCLQKGGTSFAYVLIFAIPVIILLGILILAIFMYIYTASSAAVF